MDERATPSQWAIRNAKGNYSISILTGRPMTFAQLSEAEECRADLDFMYRGSGPFHVVPYYSDSAEGKP